MDISPITTYKKIVDEALTKYLVKKQGDSINTPERKLIDRLLPFVTSGKSIRGCLALFSFSLFSHKSTSQILDVAVALELLHSGLLIHDDIMDRDETRRGNASIYTQYAEYGKSIHTTDSAHFGVSMGINAADFCFFSGYELLGNFSSDIAKFISNELVSVTAAQMQDVTASLTPQKLLEADILSVYRYKTARYTFSLPLVVGAKLAGASNQTLKTLDALGENIGSIFQIRDDELNLFGKADQTGKPVGGDIRENKQTLIYFYLTQANPTIQLHTLSLDALTKLYTESGIKTKITETLTALQTSIDTHIRSLILRDEDKKILQALAEFAQTREN